jgi:predicted DNA-binding antitoxin AbrB/MazE fold protein
VKSQFSKEGDMEKTIRAKFKKGMIEPLERLELEEGKEILVTIKDLPSEDRFVKAMGGWKGTIDCEELLKDIYESRRISAKRPGVKL